MKQILFDWRTVYKINLENKANPPYYSKLSYINSWKNLLQLVGCTTLSTNESHLGKRTVGSSTINDIKKSFENLSQEKIQNAIDLQPKIMEAIIAENGGYTNYLCNGSVS